MPQPIVPRSVLIALVAAALLLPVAICVVVGVSGLLAAMGDAAGGAVLQRIALGCGILWGVNLVALVVVLAIGAIRGPNDPGNRES
jgi:hypothetical protein